MIIVLLFTFLYSKCFFIATPEVEHIFLSILLEAITNNLCIKDAIIDSNYSIMLIDAGLRTPIVPIDSISIQLTPNLNEYQRKVFA